MSIKQNRLRHADLGEQRHTGLAPRAAAGAGCQAGPVARLTAPDVACWVVKSTRPPAALVPGWAPGGTAELTRCVRPSYRLGLMRPGQRCLLWVSGRDRPGVHALGELTGEVADTDGGPVVPVAFTLLAEPVARAALLADPAARDAEVLRMPAGSNPSWLSAGQFAAVLALADGDAGLSGAEFSRAAARLSRAAART